MKNLLFLLVVLGLAYSMSLYSNIENSHHNFKSFSGELCIVCHIPHNAKTTAPKGLLWNHVITTATFQTYSSPTLSSVTGQPGGTSLLCLSCHDGSVAIGSYGNMTGTWFYPGKRSNIGVNLSNDHPISIAYNSALVSKNSGLYDPSTQSSGLGSTIDRDLLKEGKIECSTCHDVHVKRNIAGCSGCHGMHGGSLYKETLSLRKANTGSAFCLTCHIK
jgi:hypothetical protein